MNAYELASNILAPNCVVLEEDKLLIANMLRQQADKIAELEKVIQLNDEALKPMLIDCIKKNLSVIDANLFFAKYDSVRGVKERTTPQTKPLSDEEIQEIYKNSVRKCESVNSYRDYVFDFMIFARAIEAKVRGEK